MNGDGPRLWTRRTPSSTAGTATGGRSTRPGSRTDGRFRRPWWLVGGWSIDAFTGVPREHEDVDLSILACDVPAFRAHLGDAWTPWSNDGGTLRPLSDRFPEPFDAESQIWLRRDASSPWVVDLPITPDREGLWTSKRWSATWYPSTRSPGWPTTASAT